MMYKAVREMHIGWITPETYIEMDPQGNDFTGPLLSRDREKQS